MAVVLSETKEIKVSFTNFIAANFEGKELILEDKQEESLEEKARNRATRTEAVRFIAKEMGKWAGEETTNYREKRTVIRRPVPNLISRIGKAFGNLG